MVNSFRAGLLAAIEHENISMAEMARRSGVSLEQLRKLSQRDTARTNAEDAIRLARALGTTVEALAGGAPPAPPGMAPSELIASRDPLPSINLPETAPFRLQDGFPGFGMLAGDWIAVDLRRPATTGDIVVATIADPDTGSGRQVLRRFLPPWLAPDHGTGDLMRADAEHVAILGPVAGVLRDMRG